MIQFANREEAGKQLADQVFKRFVNTDDEVVVCALPRGGVPLAFQIASVLHAPMDLLISKKIGHPTNPEFAIGAVGEHGKPIVDKKERQFVDDEWFAAAVSKAQSEMRRRHEKYLRKRPEEDLEDKTVVITDDGVATGLTMRAAIQDANARGADKIIVAVPVMPGDVHDSMQKYVDDIICLFMPDDYFGAVGRFYKRFDQVTDHEVIEILDKAEELIKVA
jgi:putative phosphoribosyl transferase